MADRIQLTGIQVHANHGVLPHETEFGQPFTVDITCWLDFAAAAAGDNSWFLVWPYPDLRPRARSTPN